jgi:uncharacterized protein (DUF1697 family)
MAVFVLLLRAIGPGTHERMSMAALREGCESAGFSDVVTVGNTGNLILRSRTSAAATRKAVQAVVEGFGLGPSVEVFVRTPRQMQMVVWASPFPDAAEDHPAYVGVCSFHKTPSWAGLKAHEGPMKFATSGAHLIRDAGRDGAYVRGVNVEKMIGARMTERNWRVFKGLAEKAAALAKT